jgi:hypothetical protein
MDPIKIVLYGGTLSEDLGLTEIEVEIKILFEDKFQFWDDLEHFGKWTYDTTTGKEWYQAFFGVLIDLIILYYWVLGLDYQSIW